MLKIQEKIYLYKIRTQRDQRAFERIMSEHIPALKRFLIFKMPREEDAEDAFSTTLLRIWNYFNASEVESVSGLIFTIARGVVAEFYRSKKNETVSIDGHEESLVDLEEKLETKIDVEIIREKIKELGTDEELQLALELRFFEGLTIKEVAKRIQKSESATRTMIHRLIKKIRVEFSKKYGQ